MKLPIALLVGLIFWGGFFVTFTSQAWAISIAEQTQQYSSSLNVWQAIQELGTNLSGTAQNFTFRVSTSRSNLDQFDYTAENSVIFDKSDNNSYILGCVPLGSNPADRLRGLTFNKAAVPAGYQDVTIDFSCRNYSFTAGHKYLIQISNANIGNLGSGKILFGAATYEGNSNDYFTGGGLRYANGNIYDYSNNSGICNPLAYIWNSTNPYRNGCYVWTTPKDDLYFVLNNNAPPPPPPKTPVVFIPGIGGSELKATQDIVWSSSDGHGGTYSHAYSANEKIWVNDSEATKLGDDDYFDVLRLKADGVTSEADLSLTGNLTSFGYGDIDSFFTGMGYVKGTNFFTFTYDWRKDVRSNKDSLDSLIEQAKTSSGQSKVNLVVHSIGGLIARYYISDSTKAAKVNKLIELGVPHLGSPLALKAIMNGIWITVNVFSIKLGIIPPSEVKDVFQNLPSAFQLLPSKSYYEFYNNTYEDLPYPFLDDRDIDNNKITGPLSFDQTKNLLANLGHNMTIFSFGEQFHDLIDASLNQSNGVQIYIIGGIGSDTIGQIHETWLVKWPIKLIPIIDEIKIDGDDTAPVYSAIPKNNLKDLTGATKVYYVVQKHADMPKAAGITMQTVKAILNEDSLPVEVKDQKIEFAGKQISVFEGELDLYDDLGNHTGLNDKGEIEANIPDTSFSVPENSRHAFIKKGSKKIKIRVTSKKKGTVNTKIRHYQQDKVSKTAIYRDVPITESAKIEFTLDPAIDTSPALTLYPDSTKPESTNINPTSEVSGSAALDQIPPTTSIQISGNKDSSGIYSGPVTITLTGNDSGSGILKIEYSLDNGVTVQTYSSPLTISTSGKNILQIKSIDKLGNEEITQSITIEIAAQTTSGTSSSNSSSSSSNTTSNTTDTSTSSPNVTVSITSPPSVLGVSFDNPSHVSDEINVSGILNEQKNPEVSKITTDPAKQNLNRLLIASAGIVTVVSLGLASTFLKPAPK